MSRYPLQIPQDIWNNIYHERQEICANINRNSQTRHLELYNRKQEEGDNEQEIGRGSCIYEKYTEIIFHTHPIVSYNPPSQEDIAKVWENDEIKTSVIASSWGLWQIIRQGPSKLADVPKDLLKQTFNEYYMTNISPQIKEQIDQINIVTMNPEYQEWIYLKKVLIDDTQPIKNIPWNQLSQRRQQGVFESIATINQILQGENMALIFRPWSLNKNKLYDIYYYRF